MKPVLCYVSGPWAYFTTQPLEDQWGDDWNDAPYEHNAGTPYEYIAGDAFNGEKPWEIIKMAWEGPFNEPCYGVCNSDYSVEEINKCVVPWLKTDTFAKHAINIYAGCELDQFCKLIQDGGGRVYTLKQEDV